MKTISQRDLRNGSAAVMDELEQGQEFEVTRHGVVVGVLRPAPSDAFVPVGDLKRAFAGVPPVDYEALRAEADVLFGEDRIDVGEG